VLAALAIFLFLIPATLLSRLLGGGAGASDDAAYP